MLNFIITFNEIIAVWRVLHTNKIFLNIKIRKVRKFSIPIIFVFFFEKYRESVELTRKWFVWCWYSESPAMSVVSASSSSSLAADCLSSRRKSYGRPDTVCTWAVVGSWASRSSTPNAICACIALVPPSTVRGCPGIPDTNPNHRSRLLSHTEISRQTWCPLLWRNMRDLNDNALIFP